MQLSEQGFNLIKQFEGLRLKAYKPVATEKYWTIGYGHCGPDIHKDMVITKEQAESFFRQDLKKFEKAVSECVKIRISQAQFDSLVSFAYNCGIGALKSSTLLEQLNRGNFQTAANEFLKWNKSGNTILEGLTNRRKAERRLFLSNCKRVLPDALNIRGEANTTSAIVKVLKQGDVLPIFEKNKNWGKTSLGWACLDYLGDVWTM